MLRLRCCVLLASVLASGLALAQEGLVAHWSFDEGSGTRLRDLSGNGNDGVIHGAAWVKQGRGHALRFDGMDDYVDCGNGPSLDLTEQVTLEAWIRPETLSSGEPMVFGKYYDSYGLTLYKDGNFWFYISGGGNNASSRAELNTWNHVVATFDGKDLKLYLNHVFANQDTTKSTLISHGNNFLMGVLAADPAATDAGYSGTAFWRGTLDEARVYNRALTPSEIAARYREAAAEHGVNTAWFDRVKVTLYPFRTERQVLAILDASGVLDRPAGSVLTAELVAPGATEALQTREVREVPSSGQTLVTFTTTDLPAGEYMVRTALKAPDGKAYAGEARLRHPPPPLQVPGPAYRVASLPAAPPPLPFRVEMQPGGGFALVAKGRRLPVQSAFSFPGGGDNRLVAAKPDQRGEPGWAVTTKQTGKAAYEMTAKGKSYSLRRTVRVEARRVYVTDTLNNTGTEDVGIMWSHGVDAGGKPPSMSYLAGYPGEGERKETYSPSVFMCWPDLGLGIVPLDDLSIIQGAVFMKDKRGGVSNDRFGLPPGASHTFEWAIYPQTSPDYYDFINQVRRDEQRNGRVEGGFAFVSRSPFVREIAEMRKLYYASFGCLTNVADDPEIEIEGIDFLWLPKERERIRNEFNGIRGINPDLKMMFHLAHTLISTNRPTEVFPDSRVIGADGTHLVWPYDYMSGGYFSKQRGAEGWKWYAYYPMPGNSFHDALMKSVDSMVDDIGCNGAFMDGFFCGYVSPWTYDRWDERTVEMNPATRTIKRKYASVLWLSQPSMVEFTEKMTRKGAVVVANNTIMTRTIGKLPIVVDQECRSGPDVHLAQTPCSLGNPTNIRGDADVYADVLDKLAWGNLYFYYGEPHNLAYASLPQQQFPITIESIHAGTVRGKERIVTMKSGVYGWPGARELHLVYRYNSIGAGIPAEFLTTADSAGVRTEVKLGPKESAAIVRVPVKLESASAVNLVLEQYSPERIALTLNGRGAATLVVSSGDFAVAPGSTYQVSGVGPARADAKGVLRVPLKLQGQTTLTITKG